MIITEIKRDWYMVKTKGLVFFGRSKADVMNRALLYITAQGAANG